MDFHVDYNLLAFLEQKKTAFGVLTLLIKHRERHPTCKSFNPAICKEEL